MNREIDNIPLSVYYRFIFLTGSMFNTFHFGRGSILNLQGGLIENCCTYGLKTSWFRLFFVFSVLPEGKNMSSIRSILAICSAGKADSIFLKADSISACRELVWKKP